MMKSYWKRKGFIISAEVPIITVTVEGANTGSVVTAFKALPDEIRWQNSMPVVFPDTVEAVVNGELADIPVSWQTKQDYNEEAPEEGLYVFDAVLEEGYILADDLELPRITVYIPESVGRVMRFYMSGSAADTKVLEITTEDQLAEIAELVNSGILESFLFHDPNQRAYIKLKNDIDLSAYSQGYNGGKGWKPIGNIQPFKGIFDGNGFSISNLYIHDSHLNHAGLFGRLEKDAEIKNLTLTGVDIQVGNNVGAIAAELCPGRIEDCYVSGNIRGNQNVAVIAAVLEEDSLIERCAAEADIRGEEYCGGIAGRIEDGAVFVFSGNSWGIPENTADIKLLEGTQEGAPYDPLTELAANNSNANISDERDMNYEKFPIKKSGEFFILNFKVLNKISLFLL